MMANAWRDPAWRAAFLLSARQISTHGNCDTPAPPDGTAKARHNPFAAVDECASHVRPRATATSDCRAPGSLVDGFCSRCHMPTNYVDNVPLHNVTVDAATGLEHGALDVPLQPDVGQRAPASRSRRSTRSCATPTRARPASSAWCATAWPRRGTRRITTRRDRAADSGVRPRAGHAVARAAARPAERDMFDVPEPDGANLGYGVGAGAYRLSPHAIAFPERLGPLAVAAARGGAGSAT